MNLNLPVLEAEAAVERAPNAALKAETEKHLERVRKGQKSKRPAFYWPRKKERVEKKAAIKKKVKASGA